MTEIEIAKAQVLVLETVMIIKEESGVMDSVSLGISFNELTQARRALNSLIEDKVLEDLSGI